MKLRPYSRRVYYYETDKMGIVHHSNYIRWFEEARVDLIEQAGLPFETVEAQGLMTPVLSAESTYKLPFKFGDVFIVKAYIPDFGGARFSVHTRRRQACKAQIPCIFSRHIRACCACPCPGLQLSAEVSRPCPTPPLFPLRKKRKSEWHSRHYFRQYIRNWSL